MNSTPSASSSVLTFRQESPVGTGIKTEPRNSQTPVPLLQISQTHRPLRFKEKFQTLREKYDQVTVTLQETKKELAIATEKEQKMQAELDALLDAVLISDAAASLVQYSQIPTSLDDGAYREYPYASMEAEREYSRRRELGFEREYEYLERERGLEYAAREREMHYERERDRERQMNGEAERDRRMERLEREREMERERQRALERELEKEEREKEMLSQRDDMEHTFYANGGQAAPRRRHGMTKSREYGELRAWRAQPEPENPPLRYVHEYSDANGRGS